MNDIVRVPVVGIAEEGLWVAPPGNAAKADAALEITRLPPETPEEIAARVDHVSERMIVRHRTMTRAQFDAEYPPTPKAT